MLPKYLAIVTVSLAATSIMAACTIDKGTGDESSSSATATDSASSASNSGTTGGDDPTDSPPQVTTSAGTTGELPGDDTGSTGPTGESNQPCIDTPTVLAVDESSPLGFSAAQLLEGKLGKRSTTLTFASDPTVLSDDLKNKQLPLEVELRHDGGEVRFIDSSENPDYDDSGNESGFIDCTDRLEIDVEVDFVTAAKEFDEHRKGTLTATTVDRADLDVALSPPGLEGSLDPAAVYTDPEWVITKIDLGGTWQGTSAGGSVLNEVLVGGDGGFAGYGPIAGWGDAIDL
jgi:hypothetical protein